MQQRRGRVLEYGVILLLMELFNVGLTNVPPITLIAILGQVGLYTGIINVSWDKWDVCLNAKTIMKQREYRRMLLSAVEHSDDMHLYYNMLSLLIKGRTLERRMGSKNFVLLLFILTVLTSSIYVGLGWACTNLLDDGYYMKSCAIGFSGVLFALKVLTSEEQSTAMRYAVWTELIVIYLLVPGSSFMGHLAGILAGLTFSKTRLGTAMKKIMEFLTGDSVDGNSSSSSHYSSNSQQSYYSSSYRHSPGPSYFSQNTYNRHRNAPPYGWNIG
ncbi:hypothetical protein B566_EDAN008654 [Ephemera danica]|nr:hypothetical protein B566_EDAN008654 [Ephemera danica]